MSNTKRLAEVEFEILQRTTPDAIILEFKDEILALVDKFGNSGQSGSSAPYTAGAISQAVKHLCLQQPISPITGDKEEFREVGGDAYQNTRCGAVFTEGENGRPYYLDAIVWKGEEEWDKFTGSVYLDDIDFELLSSRQYIKLPFRPKTFYVDVVRIPITKEEAEERDLYYIEGNEFTTENGTYTCYYSIVKDKKQLDEVFEYYDKFNW